MGLGLATALTTAVSVTLSLENKCIYSVAERLYDHIKRERSNFTSEPGTSQTSVETVLGSEHIFFNLLCSSRASPSTDRSIEAAFWWAEPRRMTSFLELFRHKKIVRHPQNRIIDKTNLFEKYL